MTNSSPWYRWPIEIDGLPFLKMVDLSMAMLNNQMVSLLIMVLGNFAIPNKPDNPHNNLINYGFF